MLSVVSALSLLMSGPSQIRQYPYSSLPRPTAPQGQSALRAGLQQAGHDEGMAYEHFSCAVTRLKRDFGQSSIALVHDTIPNEENVIPVNSLVFQIQGQDDYVLAILESNERVNVSALQDATWPSDKRKKLYLASDAQALCGFAPGTIPPLGLDWKPPLYTMVEDSLLLHSRDKRLLGGGGQLGLSLRVSLDLLLKQPNVELKSFRQEKIVSIQQGVVNNGYASLSTIAPKPYFCAAPPDMNLAKQILSDSSSAETPLQSVPVSVVGRISGVRRIAKLLVFCDLAPDDKQNHGPYDLPWKSAETGSDMAVQLIVGKTLVQNIGAEEEAAAAMRSLKVGQCIWVKGKTNVQSRDSVRNWVIKQSLDVVVESFQILLDDNGTSNRWVEQSTLALTPQKGTITSRVLGRRPAWTPTEGLPYVTMKEIYPEGTVQVVDSLVGVKEFANDLSDLILSLTAEDNRKTGLVGIDCEWLPSFYLESSSQPQPVLLLQICLHPLKSVYLLDLQSLLRPLMEPTEIMDELESAVATSLGNLFQSTQLIKVGFQVSHDLRQLAASYPHMSQLQTANAVCETSHVAKKVMHLQHQRTARIATSSLGRLTEAVLEKGLSKDEQCSDWSLRPLTQSQIEYAALDAVITPVIVNQLLESVDAHFFGSEPQLGRWKEDKSFVCSLLSWRFVFLEQTASAHVIRKLNAKRIVGDLFLVAQRWATGEHPPRLPSISAVGGEPYTDQHGDLRYPSEVVSFDLPSFHLVMDGVLGKFMGRSKERCLTPFLMGATSLPEDARLDFPQRSGFIEMENAFFLFVNMPSGKGRAWSYPNEWLEDGQILTWFMRETEWKRGSSRLAQKLLATGDKDSPTVVSLFVRVGKESFLCCGRCRLVHIDRETDRKASNERDGNLVTLNLILIDWVRLQSSPDFRALVNPLQ